MVKEKENFIMGRFARRSSGLLFVGLLLAVLSLVAFLSAVAGGNPLSGEVVIHSPANVSIGNETRALIFSHPCAVQDVITTVLPSDDTYVWHYRPNNSFGKETSFWVYPNDGIPLLKFPLDAIPEGAEIISATMTFTMASGAYPWGRGDVAAVQVLTDTDWTEDTVTWNTAPDVDPNAPEAEATLNPYSANGTDTWDVTELVRYARSQGITNTLSVRIYPKRGAWRDSHEWQSKEGGRSRAPRLRIVFRPAAATPTPTPTSTPTSPPAPTPTPTPTVPSAPTATPTPTVGPSPTPIPTASPSPTPSLTPSATVTPSAWGTHLPLLMQKYTYQKH